MADSPNLIRDIELTKRYLNGETTDALTLEAGFTSRGRMANLITTAAMRARSVAKQMGMQGPQLDLMFLPPTRLRQHRECVLSILAIYEKQLRRGESEVSLDDPIICLHLPSRIHNVLKYKFATVRDLILHLNANEGQFAVTGMSDFARAIILQTLAKYDLSQWLTFRADPVLPDVLRQVIKLLDNPDNFSIKDRERLREDVAKKLEVYQNYRK